MTSQEIAIRVLTYFEDNAYFALAIDMDLLGCGETQESAINELNGAVEAQLAFAIQMHDPDLFFVKADQKWLDLYEEAAKQKILAIASRAFQKKDFINIQSKVRHEEITTIPFPLISISSEEGDVNTWQKL